MSSHQIHHQDFGINLVNMAEAVLGSLTVYLTGSLCLYLLFVLIKLFNKFWWSPHSIQNLMASQGVKGPPYRFFHGTTKEMRRMRNKAMTTPMELSHDIFPKVAPHVYSWTKLYGTNFLHWIGPQAQLVITDPELIKVVMNNKDGAYSKIEKRGHAKKLLGDGLAAAEGEKWQRQRKLANHAFHGEALKSMTPMMIASVEMMLERWRSQLGNEIEVFQEFKLLTSEVISRTAFGSSYLEGEEMFNMLRKMILLIHRNAYKVELPVIGKLVKTRDDVESDILEQGVRDSIIQMIKKREKNLLTGEAESFGNDYLGLLLNAYHSEDDTTKISVDDMVDECKTFYLTGQETTLCLLSWTVLLLAIHTDWQERAREEVRQLFGQENPTPHGITRLTTMGMIINESLRLYSPLVQANRKTRREVILGKLLVPANVQVSIPIIALHHNKEIWGKDVHLFKPERFAEGVAKATNNNTAVFLPFGMGPRSCVGLNFATNETKIALSMILQRYRFTVSPNYVHSPFPLLLISPQNGLQIILQPL